MSSIWLNDSKIREYEKLEKDLNVDVCIIGAGITGITTAYLLNKKNYSFALIDKDNVCMRC